MILLSISKTPFLFVLLLFMFVSPPAYAHPGNTDNSGCHQCTSCTPYGNLYRYDNLLYEYYHCHSDSFNVPTPNEGENISDILNRIKPSDTYIPETTLEPAPIHTPITPLKTIEEFQKEQQEKKEEMEKEQREWELKLEELNRKNEEIRSKVATKTSEMRPTLKEILDRIQKEKATKSGNLKSSATSSYVDYVPPKKYIVDKPKSTVKQQRNLFQNLVDKIFPTIIEEETIKAPCTSFSYALNMQMCDVKTGKIYSWFSLFGIKLFKK